MALYLGSERKTIGKYIGGDKGTDVSNVTATANDVLAPKVFVDANGLEQAGTIPTNTFDDIAVSGITVSIPMGYYNNNATISISVPTCSLKVSEYYFNSSNSYISVLNTDTGKIEYVTASSCATSATSGYVTINNVVCNTLFFCVSHNLNHSVSFSSGVELVLNSGMTDILKIPASSGVYTIDVTSNEPV